MKQYDINPRKKPKPYMTVGLYDKNPNQIAVGFPDKDVKLLFDARAGVDLIIAINELCQSAGHAYIPGLGEQDDEQ